VSGGLKHFAVVGVAFCLVLGWLASGAVTSLAAALMPRRAMEQVTDSYGSALLLTLISLGVIVASAVLGNRVFRSKVQPAPLGASSLALSTVLFLCVVSAFVFMEASAVVGPATGHLQYLNQHPEAQRDILLALSLPLLRLVALPIGYFLSALSSSRRAQAP
jgi:hypothetical protein